MQNIRSMNENDKLIERLADFICNSSYDLSKVAMSYYKERHKTESLFKKKAIFDKHFFIYKEIVGFLVHFTSRLIFSKAGSEVRDQVLEKLASLIIDKTNSLDPIVHMKYFKRQSIEDIYGVFSSAEQDYSQYTIVPKNDNPKNTLVWELSKKIAMMCYTTDIVLIMHL